MKKLLIGLFTISAILCFLLVSTETTEAIGFYEIHDFETSWTGDYATDWELEGYRHGAPPVAKMEQIDVSGIGGSGYGAKVYVDSVPNDSMWWANVKVTGIPANFMNTIYDPWVSVDMYDHGYSSGIDSIGQLYTVPSLVTGASDWTDIQFGGRPWGSPEGSYYYTWADLPHPPWQEITSLSRPNLDQSDNPHWVNLKIQLSSTDNKMHYYLNGTEVGTSTRKDYLDLGSLQMAVMFNDPLTDWGSDKPYVIIDNFEYGSTVPEPGTMLLLGSGLIGLAGFRRRFKKS